MHSKSQGRGGEEESWKTFHDVYMHIRTQGLRHVGDVNATLMGGQKEKS